MEEKRIALIGCGAIGTVIATAIREGKVPARLTAVLDTDATAAKRLAGELGSGTKVVSSIDELMKEGADLVVEAANQDAVREHAETIVSAGVDIMVMSTGALLDESLRRRLTEAAQRGGARVYLPSGAVGGIDAIGALRLAGIQKVSLTVRKPPAGLATFLEEHGIDPLTLREPRILFEGDVKTAVALFPANVNVAATLSIASGAQMEVRVIADPTVNANVHEIEVFSTASKLKLRFENIPHPQNPKTSYLAGLAAVRLLQRIVGQEIQVGN